MNLIAKQGEIHAIMGPNGTGKSTLAYTLMGHPSYTVTKGEVLFKGQNVLELEPDERSRLGIFLAFQYPVSIPGVTVANFLRTALNARRRAEEQGRQGHADPRVPEDADGQDAAAEDGSGFCGPLPERGLFRRRKEAGRDPPDGDACNLRSPSWTRRIPAWILTRCASSPMA